MKRQWRFLVSQDTYADCSISTSPALERGVMEGISPNTVLLDIFPADSFTIGVLDDPEKAIDLDFCRRRGIVVLRRNTTGGTIYAGKGSAMICYFLRLSEPGVPKSIGDAFPKLLGDFAQGARELFGFPAKYRPLNDVEVEGRKLMPTSCKIERDTMVLRVVLNVKPQDVEVTSQAILMPPEKVQDKALKTMEARFTYLEREACRGISAQDLETYIRRVVHLSFGDVLLTPGGMNDAERKYGQEFTEKFSRESWFLANSESLRFKTIPPGVRRGDKRVKAPAGLVRAVVLKKEGRIHDLILTGDFHPRPITILSDMENSLRGAPAQTEEIGRRIKAFYGRAGVEISGTTPEDFISAVTGALE
ncbi:MAG: lipM 1 [Deltaproteobacteria bacterium]|nr:lipM 1 [Deltaproteobacteria bacterium]